MTNDDVQMGVSVAAAISMVTLLLIAGVFLALSHMEDDQEFRLACLNAGFEFTQAGMRMECKK